MIWLLRLMRDIQSFIIRVVHLSFMPVIYEWLRVVQLFMIWLLRWIRDIQSFIIRVLHLSFMIYECIYHSWGDIGLFSKDVCTMRASHIHAGLRLGRCRAWRESVRERARESARARARWEKEGRSARERCERRESGEEWARKREMRGIKRQERLREETMRKRDRCEREREREKRMREMREARVSHRHAGCFQVRGMHRVRAHEECTMRRMAPFAPAEATLKHSEALKKI